MQLMNKLKVHTEDWLKIHHPDKIQNLGDSYKKIAKEKFQKIQDAYEKIKKERAIK